MYYHDRPLDGLISPREAVLLCGVGGGQRKLPGEQEGRKSTPAKRGQGSLTATCTDTRNTARKCCMMLGRGCGEERGED